MLYFDIFITAKNITLYIFTISHLDMKFYGESSIVIYFYLSPHKQAKRP